MCTHDFDMVQLGGPVLTRQFSLGKSESYCDFHYKKEN